MGNNYQEKLVGVFGDPVDENPSVVIEQAAFDYYKIPYRYLTVQVKEPELKQAMEGMRAMNFSGINLTMPHKQNVLPYLDEISHTAAIIGAVNTVYRKKGRLYGENTDGKGFMQNLKNGSVEVAGKKAVILGAGGVARAISVELAKAGIVKIVIVNIVREQGEELTKLLNDKTKTKAEFVFWEGTFLVPEDTDLFVNATSIGFENANELPDVDYDSLPPKIVVCDVIPNQVSTRFLKEAEKRNCRVFNGLQMLVYQGAFAFEIWTGLEAPVDVMANALMDVYGVKSSRSA